MIGMCWDMGERMGQINLRHMFQKMKQDTVTYHDEIEEYIRGIQCIFCACLFVFFALHIVVRSILDLNIFHALNEALWISVLQMGLSLGWYFLFKYYLDTHKKYILYATYLNIFQITALLELQYFLYDEFISYTIIICIILSTALTIIGHIRGYMSIMTLIVSMDAITTIVKNYHMVDQYSLCMYIIDNFFVILFVVGINFFFSKLKCEEFEKKRQILYLSERDGLTALLNRRALKYLVQKHENEHTLCAMILLDLDNFKALNDTLGHCQGDNCLCAVADVLREIFDKTDYISRLGGDEFMIFMPDIADEREAMHKAHMLLQRIPRQYPYEGGAVAITCSIGVVFLPADKALSYEELYKCADIAMYASKENGKNTVTVYTQDLDAVVLDDQKCKQKV